MAWPRPIRLAASLSAPSGQKIPHHARPKSTMLRSTNGHQRPQKANCAKRVRLFQMCAARQGEKGRHADEHEVNQNDGPLAGLDQPLMVPHRLAERVEEPRSRIAARLTLALRWEP